MAVSSIFHVEIFYLYVLWKDAALARQSVYVLCGHVYQVDSSTVYDMFSQFSSQFYKIMDVQATLDFRCFDSRQSRTYDINTLIPRNRHSI
jgi:hypothetical protein